MDRIIALKEIDKVNGAPAEIGEKVFDTGHIEIYEWDSLDGEFWGYVRDDSASISVVTCFESYEDEETVAAWNCDFDIKKTLKRIDAKIMVILLKIAQEKSWQRNI